MNKQTITIKVDTKTLNDVCQNAVLGEGTFDNPIAADSFVELKDLDKIKENTEMIEFVLEPKNENKPFNLSLSCILFKNVTNSDVIKGNNKIESIFLENFIVKEKSELQGRLLCLEPYKENIAHLYINIDSEPSEDNNYYAFTTIFTMDIGTSNKNQTCCFSIDPILRARSRGARR